MFSAAVWSKENGFRGTFAPVQDCGGLNGTGKIEVGAEISQTRALPFDGQGSLDGRLARRGAVPSFPDSKDAVYQATLIVPVRFARLAISLPSSTPRTSHRHSMLARTCTPRSH